MGQQASAGQGNAQPDAALSAEQGAAAAAVADAGDHSLGRYVEYPVTVQSTPVVSDVPAGFGRQASELADAASNINDAHAAVSERQLETAAQASDVNAKPLLAVKKALEVHTSQWLHSSSKHGHGRLHPVPEKLPVQLAIPKPVFCGYFLKHARSQFSALLGGAPTMTVM